ncbi:MAG: OmpA family protein [Polyangiaceae bacterium]
MALLAGIFLAACGGTTQFAGAQPFAIAGTPPPPVVAAAPKPEPRVVLKDNKIEFKDKIQFDDNKATIKSESDSLLHDIAQVIKDNPQVKKISIEGNASAEGNAAHNKTLSQQRAKSVLDYLVKNEGIDATRLTSTGWGSDKPIASNDTEEGREANRRVEFLVVDQDVTKKKVAVDPTTGKETVVSQNTVDEKAPDQPTSTTTTTAATTTTKAATTKKGASK